MKQLFKHFALLVMGALISGCAAEVDDLQPTTNGTVTMKTTISLSEQASTRALTEAGVKTFEVGDKIAVIYKNTNDETMKVVSAALTTDDIDATDAHKATFSVSLTNPKAGTPVRYIYPAAMAVTTIATDAAIDDAATIDYTKLATQDGTLTTLANTLDLSVFDGSLTSEATLPNTATLANQLTIGKFTITNSATDADITNTITKLTISNSVDTYTVNTSSLSTIYVAMRPFSGTFVFDATTASKTYFKNATGKTLSAGNLYSISVSMAEPVIGYVFCSDGSIYASKDAATTAGKTPVAMICYVGSASDCAHGLAIALEDVSDIKLTWNNSGTNNDSKTATEWCSAWNTSKAVTGGTWRLPSLKDWQYMLIGCGASGSYNDNPNIGDSMSYSELASKLSTAQGTALQENFYWSSMESNPGSDAWGLLFNGSNAGFATGFESYGFYVRACLAF